MTATISPYTETLGQAIQAIENDLVRRCAVLALEGKDWLDVFSFGGIPYGQSKEAHGQLASVKGKPTKKYIHATIWRRDSGTYEWNTYVL